MLGVLHLLSQALGWLALAMLLPALVALVAEDRVGLEGFLLAAGLTGFVAGAIFFALRGRRWRLNRAAGLFPYRRHMGHPARDRSGADHVWRRMSIICRHCLKRFPALRRRERRRCRPSTISASAVIFWRAELQWLGGLLTLISMVALLAPAGAGGLTGRGVAPLGPAGEAGLGRSIATVRTIVIMYTVGTGLCLGLLIADRR